MNRRIPAMKQYQNMLLAGCILCCLTGCTVSKPDTSSEISSETSTASSASDSNNAESSAAEKEKPTAPDLSIYTDMPVISFVTKNQDSNVMKFVTEPVAQHVALLPQRRGGSVVLALSLDSDSLHCSHCLLTRAP